MGNKSKQKGNKGHKLTEDLLHSIGWTTYTAPHIDITYQVPGTPEFRKTGCNDIYAVPKLDQPWKKEGGFDIIANKNIFLPGTTFSVASYWQAKKTKADPFNMKWKSNRELRDKTLRSVEQFNLPPKWCFIIHWPDGVGLSRGVPRIWRCDDTLFEVPAEELRTILEVL